MKIIALFLVLLAASPVDAHALGVTATLRGNRIEVEAYYSDNTPARNARVTVQDKNVDWPIAQGRTDDRGQWQFPAPRAGRYEVVVDAGAGHLKSVPIVIPDNPALGEIVSRGPTRDEFTHIPWVQIALGLAIIAALAFAWLALRRRFRKMPGPRE